MQPSVTCPVCGGSPAPSPFRAPDRLHGTPGRFEVAVCPDCGTGVTLPPAGPRELAAAYPEGYGPYGALPHPVLRAISAAILRWQGWLGCRRPPLDAVAAHGPGRGVDVGCGRGDVAAMLIRRGWRMTGVDPSPAACAAARERGVDAREGILESVALEPGAYDAAIFNQSLEHTGDPLGDLRRIRAALRPGAVVAIAMPNFGGWQARRFRGRWFHLDLPRHRVHFTAPALERALREAGFEDVRTGTSTSLVGLPASIQYRIWGRCLFPEGLPLRVARLANALGGGDVLYATARRPA